ncbi:putative translation initiation inhibitor, yjgF family [Rivularia sp. PCC 7116]|uniref:RidA family protein n=1 Tax=Rivularia sp. PCC 7116 TaxID=373994 RepID=UPI00029F2C9F|nr:RidA family protein [Rivularia sp. PCC 7116]AFY59085.1 putative translation initiation inhibitor, yjgF family [Rivularia sp. PCC 7116]
MQITRTFSGASWESTVGYCRAIKAGNHIYVSGTTAVAEDGSVFAPGNAYAQAKRCFEIVKQALQNLNADIHNVTRTRMYVTDISLWAEFGKAHQEFFAENPPASTMLEVNSLIDSAMLIEVEVDAVCLD